jgi:hypothetical protein
VVLSQEKSGRISKYVGNPSRGKEKTGRISKYVDPSRGNLSSINDDMDQ